MEKEIAASNRAMNWIEEKFSLVKKRNKNTRNFTKEEKNESIYLIFSQIRIPKSEHQFNESILSCYTHLTAVNKPQQFSTIVRYRTSNVIIKHI